MKLGDTVKWSSQANGVWREKQGRIVKVIPAGEEPIINEFDGSHRIRLGGGAARKDESYLVEVPAPGKGMPSLYWPLTSKLTEVSQAA